MTKKQKEEGARKSSRERIKQNNKRLKLELGGLQTAQKGGRPFQLVLTTPSYEDLHPMEDTYLQLLLEKAPAPS